MNDAAATGRFPGIARSVSAALLLAATAVAAKEDTDKGAEKGELETVTVIGRTTNVDISSEDIDRLQANDLADIFRLVPSVSVGGSVGIAQKVYIRGLEDTLLNVTVDGAPQTGTLFHHIGRVNIEPELLRQVEVQAGAGEATSGFGAIGGAIRFRTKDAEDLLSGNQRFGSLAKVGYFDNDGYKLSLTGYGRLSDDWSLLGSMVGVDRENMTAGDGNTLYGTAAEQSLGFFKVSGDLSPDQRLSISYEQRKEEGEFGQRPNWPALEGETLFPAEAERRTFVANYLLATSSVFNLEVTAYHTRSNFEQDRFDRWGLYGAEIESYGFDLRNTSRVGPHELIYGVEYRSDTVSSEYLSDPALGKFEEEGEVSGIYLQDHYRIAAPVLLSFGLRYDAYDLEQVTYGDSTDSSGVSANLGVLYAITDSVSFSAGYAEAMRGKEVGDAFTLETGGDALADNLNAEKVKNTEIGLDYDDGHLRAGVSVYRMEIEDVILDQLGNGVYYENVGKLEADGVELKLGYSTAHFSADLFYVTNDPELNGNVVEGYEHIGLGNASGDTWMLNLGYRQSDKLEFGWSMRHVEDLNDIVVLHRAVEIGWIDSLQTVDKPAYTVHDIFVEWTPLTDDSLTLGLAVYNLLDEHYRDHASVADYNHISDWEGIAGVYEAGRDVRLSVAYAF